MIDPKKINISSLNVSLFYEKFGNDNLTKFVNDLIERYLTGKCADLSKKNCELMLRLIEGTDNDVSHMVNDCLDSAEWRRAEEEKPKIKINGSGPKIKPKIKTKNPITEWQ